MDEADASLPGTLAFEVPVLDQLGFDALDLNPVPLDGDGLRDDLLIVLAALALHGEDDPRIPFPPDLFDRLLDGHVDGGFFVDLRDVVIPLESCLLGGGVFEYLFDLEFAGLVRAHQHANAEDLSPDLHLELLETFRGKDEGVGVDPGEIAISGGIPNVVQALFSAVVDGEEGEDLLEQLDSIAAGHAVLEGEDGCLVADVNRDVGVLKI